MKVDYELMQRRLTLLAALSKGERAILEKRTVTNAQARERMAKWLK
ncbi:MAG TPA: hypothetical protein VF275_03480 [Gammaproteobacteria bacterium]